MNSITYGNEKFIAVGNNGRVTTTTDGLSWESDLGRRSQLVSSCMVGSFVAIGDNGSIATNIDGVVWVHKQIGDGSRWDGVVYINEQFIIGNGSQLMNSLMVDTGVLSSAVLFQLQLGI